MLPNTTCIRGNAIMPSLFSYLQGYANGNIHTLEWKTTAIPNIQSFFIEQSIDGINYTVLTNMPPSVTNIYKWNIFSTSSNTVLYRIKIVGKDGYTAYSNLIKIIASAKTLLQLYPNPVVNNAMHLTYTKLEQGKYTIELFDQNGRIVFKQPIVINNTSGNLLIQLSVSIVKGNYLAVIKSSQAIMLKQFITNQ
jgi:hypothetical protein